MRREFEYFWNTLSADSPVFLACQRTRCDNERDFWNTESSFAEVFQKSKIPIPQSPIRSPQPPKNLASSTETWRVRKNTQFFVLENLATSRDPRDFNENPNPQPLTLIPHPSPLPCYHCHRDKT
jgi:hypothetical protein